MVLWTAVSAAVETRAEIEEQLEVEFLRAV
jgi:hypothetical protein